MENIKDLSEYIICLLKEAGFTPDLYFLKIGVSSVEVHFDHPGAVDYFKNEIKNCDQTDKLIFEKRKARKRYIAYIQMW